MKLKGLKKLATCILSLTLGAGALLTPAGPGIANTGEPLEFHRVAETDSDVLPYMASLSEFVYQVVNGRAGQIVGLYAENILSFPVQQQPANNPAYVTTQRNLVTQFGMATQYGSTGLMAHNTLAGLLFYYLTEGQRVTLVFGDGSLQHFTVDEVRHLQALSPNSTYSNFVDLDHGGPVLSAEQLFYQIYAVEGRLVLQTCLFNHGNPSWGRLFIIATPLEPQQLAETIGLTQG